jgi:alkylation response protein AidB-like acyl-CoA dehydrogenase
MGLGASFQGLDYADVDSLLSEEEKMIRDSVRAWVTEHVLPVIEHHFRDGTFPTHLIPAIGEMGLLGANLHGYGCAGLGPVAYGLIMQELERGDSGPGRSCRFKAASSCIRFTPSAAKPKNNDGFRRWPRERPSVASD